MTQQFSLPEDFWIELERNVSFKVGNILRMNNTPKDLIISCLRDLETMARTTCDRRQTIQIIASARSLLGDRTSCGPDDGPFAHALA